MSSLTISNILALFYFGYWIYHNSQPFSIWWLVGIYITLFIIQNILLSIFKKTEKAIEKKALDVDEKLKEFELRLKLIESSQKTGEKNDRTK